MIKSINAELRRGGSLVGRMSRRGPQRRTEDGGGAKAYAVKAIRADSPQLVTSLFEERRWKDTEGHRERQEGQAFR